MGVQIWYADPTSAFLDPDVVVKIIPQSGAPLAEQLNALMRFALYLAVLLSLYHRSLMPALYILVLASALTVAIDYHDRVKSSEATDLMEKLDVTQDDFDNLCTVPTKENPFMNVMPTDLADFPSRPQACDVTQTDVKDTMEKKFNHKLYRNSDDIYGRESSSRQFYTMPVTTVPNNQIEFAEWLYLKDDIDGVCRDGDMLACHRGAPPVGGGAP